MYSESHGGAHAQNIPSQQLKRPKSKVIASNRLDQDSNHGRIYEGIGLHDHYDPDGWDYVPSSPQPKPTHMPAGQPQPTIYGCYYYEYGQMQYGLLPTDYGMEDPRLSRSNAPSPMSAGHGDDTLDLWGTYSPDPQLYNHVPDPFEYPSMQIPMSTAYREVMESLGYGFSAHEAQVPPTLQPQPAMCEPQPMATRYHRGQDHNDQNTQNERVSATWTSRNPLMTLNSPFNPPAYPYTRPIAMQEDGNQKQEPRKTSTLALRPRVPLATLNENFKGKATKKHDSTTACGSRQEASEPKDTPARCPSPSYELIHKLITPGDEPLTPNFLVGSLDSSDPNTPASMKFMAPATPTEEMVMKLVNPEGRGFSRVLTEYRPQPELPQIYTSSAPPILDNTSSLRIAATMMDTLAYLKSLSTARTFSDMLNLPVPNISSSRQVAPLRNFTIGSTEASSLQPESVSNQYHLRIPIPHPVGLQFERLRSPISTSGNGTHEESYFGSKQSTGDAIGGRCLVSSNCHLSSG